MTAFAPLATKAPRRLTLAILVLISMVGPLALNIAMPVLPAFEEAFATSRENATLVLSLFLATMAVSQLFLGPLSDRFGRRPVLLTGLVLFLIASIAAIYASSITELLVARVAQALGATVGLPLARTIVRDLFDREEAASMIGYLTMAMVVVPMMSPAFGGLLADSVGWYAIFAACAIFGAPVLILVALRMPETRPASLKATTGRDVAARSFELLRSRGFLGFAGTNACASSVFFAFQGGAPFIVVDAFGVDKAVYGLWFALGGLGYMAGNFTSGRLSSRIGVERMIRVGNLIALAGAGFCLALALVPVNHAWALFVPMGIIAYANGLVIPNAIAAAVSVNPQAAGAASGLAGFLQMGLSAVASLFVGWVTATSAVPMALVMLAITFAGLMFERVR